MKRPILLLFLLLLLSLSACRLTDRQTEQSSFFPVTSTPVVSSSPTATLLPALPSGDLWQTLTWDGVERSYLLHIPPGNNPAQPTPLVVVMHGGLGNAENAARMTGFSDVADEHGFLVVYPNGAGRDPDRLLTWNGGECCGYASNNNTDDAGFIVAMLDQIAEIVAVDSARVYATGLSNGGIMSYRLACEYPDRFAAIGPVAGTLNLPDCDPAAPVAVMHIHGTADSHLPYDGGYGPDSLANTDFASVPDTVAFWVEADNCPAEPTSSEAFEDITITRYEGCDAGSEVVLITVIDGGHAWPGGEPGRERADQPTETISASEELWAFFDAHARE